MKLGFYSFQAYQLPSNCNTYFMISCDNFFQMMSSERSHLKRNLLNMHSKTNWKLHWNEILIQFVNKIRYEHLNIMKRAFLELECTKKYSTLL